MCTVQLYIDKCFNVFSCVVFPWPPTTRTRFYRRLEIHFNTYCNVSCLSDDILSYSRNLHTYSDVEIISIFLKKGALWVVCGVGQVVNEREKRLRDGMRLMGMHP